ncbi:MAG: beta-class carbonic anhydrase [Candidatus Asgardarchaeia archaeon]
MINSLLDRASKSQQEYKKVLDFIKSGKSKAYHTLVFTCMDERINPYFLFNCGVGDIIVLRNAGAYLSGDVIRSIVVGIYEKGVREIIILGHTDCGMTKVSPPDLKKKIAEINNIYEDEIDYYTGGFENWIKSFKDPYENVKRSIEILKRHPLIPEDVEIKGFVFNLSDATLEEVKV